MTTFNSLPKNDALFNLSFAPEAMRTCLKGNILDWSYNSAHTGWMVKTDKKLTVGVGNSVIYSEKLKEL